MVQGRFAPRQSLCKPEVTAIKVNVSTTMKMQFEIGVISCLRGSAMTPAPLL